MKKTEKVYTKKTATTRNEWLNGGNELVMRTIKVVDRKTNYDIDHEDYGKFIALDTIEVECEWQGYGWKITEPVIEKYPQYKGQILVDVTEAQTVPGKQEILDEMEAHNNDEVGINNQWTFEDTEYHLLLSDKYYKK